MKHFLLLLVLALVLTACGSRKNQFVIEGSLQNLDQAQLYIYSPDGVKDGIDTIQVAHGKFSYRTACVTPGTLMLVLPNNTQQPIFAQPGKKAKVSGDVTRLKELRVTGTEENKLMNAFRERLKDEDPLREQGEAGKFIEENPQSLVAIYLIEHYYIQVKNPNYRRALQLLGMVCSKQPDNQRAKQLRQRLSYVANADTNKKLPVFYGESIDGTTITESPFVSADYAVIASFAPWSATSMDIQKRMRNLHRKFGDRVQLLSVCIDGNTTRCKQVMQRDTITWKVSCPGELIEAPLVKALDLMSIPAYIIAKKGTIIKRGFDARDFDKDSELIQ